MRAKLLTPKFSQAESELVTQTEGPRKSSEQQWSIGYPSSPWDLGVRVVLASYLIVVGAGKTIDRYYSCIALSLGPEGRIGQSNNPRAMITDDDRILIAAHPCRSVGVAVGKVCRATPNAVVAVTVGIRIIAPVATTIAGVDLATAIKEINPDRRSRRADLFSGP
jgi:hypothetical protein